MGLFDNIQGNGKDRLEDGNSINATLKLSPTKFISQPTDAETTVTNVSIIKNQKIALRIDGIYRGDADYGNLINAYDFIRIYSTILKASWIDLKVTKAYLDGGFPTETLIEGIVITGEIADIAITDKVKWDFYQQQETSSNYPDNLLGGDITDTTATLSWDDILGQGISYKIKYRKYGDPTLSWTESLISGWIFETTTKLQGKNWHTPTQTYLGLPSYWMEFSEPGIKSGTKAEGWIEIKNGNYGTASITNIGSGYKKEPNIKLYFKKLADHRIEKPFYVKNVFATYILIEETGHTFEIGDDVICKTNLINGTYTILDVVPGVSFKIIPDNITEIIGDGQTKQISGFIELAPIPLPDFPGELKSTLSNKIYNIEGLVPSSIYELSVMSYFTEDLKNYSEYSPSIKIQTRD